MNYPIDVVARLQDSAREWQKLQLGALGFAGLCGVLKGDGADRPLWLQSLSGVAAAAALVLALLAITVLATVAYPVSGRPLSPPSAGRRLSGGIAVTFVAVGLTALSALSMWWPDASTAEPANQVTVTTSSGSACGSVVGSGSGSLALDVNGKQVSVPLNRLSSLQVVGKC